MSVDDYHCPRRPVPHHHWIHSRKAHGVLSGDHLLKGDQTCQGLMKILSAVTKAMLDLAKRYPKGIQKSSFLCIQFLISHVSPLDLGKKQLLNENKLLVVVYHPLTHQSPPTKSHTCTSDLASVVKRMIRSSEVSKRNFKESCQRHFDAFCVKSWQDEISRKAQPLWKFEKLCNAANSDFFRVSYNF